MRAVLVGAATVALLAAAAPATAHANWPGCPTPAEVTQARHVPGLGEFMAQALEKCMHRRRMQRLFRRCLIAAGLTAGGVAAGGISLKAAARVIGVEMVTVGAGACLNEIVNR